MIEGVVNADREATIRLVVHASDGRQAEIDAIIDTGFTGFLTLPPSLIASLDLSWRALGEAVLADGSTHLFDAYAATVIWDGRARLVETDAADTDPLVGMSLLFDHELRIQAVVGGSVTIESLP